jgi:Uma2 family endonuclease
MVPFPFTKGRAEMTTTSEKLPMLVLADGVPGPRQGEWTYSDYAALDDGQRYEIVNGVLLMTPAPSWSHQEIVLEIASYLRTYLRKTGLGGAFVAPIDVELSPHDVFQPDIVVLLKESREKLKDRHIVGAPDLVIEVTSPGTRVFDRLNKYDAYARARVPEYWLANPETQSVEVLVYDGQTYRSQGIFEGKATLPSRVVPGLPVHVEDFFASVWA